MQFRDLYYGFVIDWSFYPLTVVGEPERVAGRRDWRVKVYNNVTGTSWFEAGPDDRMNHCARPADFGPHPTADEHMAEQKRLAAIRRATEQREHEARLAKWAKDNERGQALLDSLRRSREARDAEELAMLLDPTDAF